MQLSYCVKKYLSCSSHELVQLILSGTENRVKHIGSVYFNQIQIDVNLIWAKATDTVVTVSKHCLEPTDLKQTGTLFAVVNM